VCRKTKNGLVEKVGKIRGEWTEESPDFLREFRYVIFREDDDILGLKCHSVCIDLEVDSRGTNADEAYTGLQRAINSFIKMTMEHFPDVPSAYEALKKEIENRSETREMARESYFETLGYYHSFVASNIHATTIDAYDDDVLETKYEQKKLTKKLTEDQMRELLTAMYLLKNFRGMLYQQSE
jgi:hypothetical protein